MSKLLFSTLLWNGWHKKSLIQIWNEAFLIKFKYNRSATDLTHTISGTYLNTWQIQNIYLR